MIETTNNLCLICYSHIHNGVSIIDYFNRDDIICGNCRHRFEVINQIYMLEGLRIRILYVYNDFLETLLFQFKECRDIALKNVFFKQYEKDIFDKFKGYTIIYMPSSNEKIKERGFFALEKLLQEIAIPKMHLFEKKSDYKQSLQSFDQRSNIRKVIKLKKGIVLPTTRLLLVDDVCTSGETLKHAFRLLSHHPYGIEALVLCANPRFVD